MLKEAVDLLAKASRANQALFQSDSGSDYETPWEDCLKAIDNLTAAIGRHDDGKRKTDEAICLLFRAAELMKSDEASGEKFLARAERLLGFAQLEPATVD